MRVLFLQRQPCMRTLKYAVALRARSPELRLAFAYQGVTLSKWYGVGDDLFEAWHHLGHDPQPALRRVLRAFRPDLIHSHNLPDDLTVLAQELSDGRRAVVHDVHDMQSLRSTPYEDGLPEPARDRLEVEQRAVEDSTGLIVVSDEMHAAIRARYTPPAHTCSFANYALADYLPRELPPIDGARRRRPRIVYQGTLSTNGGHYDLRDTFRTIVGQGATLDLYPSRPVPAYEALARELPGLRCHPTLSPASLCRVLPTYDFGWAGFNDSLNRAHLDTVLPNKLYEYLGCGLPVLTGEHRALAAFVRREGVGLSVAAVEDLRATLERADATALRRRVAAVRTRFTVESRIGEIRRLYDAVCG